MTGSDTSLWRPLQVELDRWSVAGRAIKLWLRDDDAVAPSPALNRLAALGERFALPVLLAVIPMLAEPALAASLRAMPLLLPCQHGCWHRNHAPASARKSEFGLQRPAEELRAEIDEARLRLEDLLGPALLPVFVPPWNRIDPAHAALLPGLGFAGLSCFRGFGLGPSGGPHLANTHLDIMDWGGGRIGRTPQDLVAEACRLLAGQRDATAGDAELGLLLHHRDHDATAWAFLDSFLGWTRHHPAIVPTDPRHLFQIPVPS
ncbi:polysaccharide deacetylase family protein [Bosea sp. (in: a-proteobacteria)]|uniref:polysaccharide deacetylase family protein n=1 Tax=Bosea sp. (in: a-proteobacteria) TaxID=1871050 RepID=UPI002735D4E3|nr:polysaccharide deacetylase family protein [Bosea sp. (in: a-proteobacteria)]MDP3408536.1 polysaccharide deacetylase family protein [Bosea sp. (in: a-proteobacteria)]